MYQLEDYITDDNFTLGTSVVPESRIRTKFDYGVRQRRAQRGLISYNTRLVLNRYFSDKFISFWDLTKEGTDTFLVNQEIHARQGNHTVRFIQPYTMNSLGNGLYEILCALEVTNFGTSTQGCPLMPTNILVPGILVPC